MPAPAVGPELALVLPPVLPPVLVLVLVSLPPVAAAEPDLMLGSGPVALPLLTVDAPKSDAPALPSSAPKLRLAGAYCFSRCVPSAAGGRTLAADVSVLLSVEEAPGWLDAAAWAFSAKPPWFLSDSAARESDATGPVGS